MKTFLIILLLYFISLFNSGICSGSEDVYAHKQKNGSESVQAGLKVYALIDFQGKETCDVLPDTTVIVIILSNSLQLTQKSVTLTPASGIQESYTTTAFIETDLNRCKQNLYYVC